MKPTCLDATDIVNAVIKAQMLGRKGIVVFYPNEDCSMKELNRVLKTNFPLDDNKIIIIPCTDDIVLEKLSKRLSEAEIRFEIHGGKNGN